MDMLRPYAAETVALEDDRDGNLCLDDMGIVADVCQSFVFDDGAFSVWKKV
jgi:hypothetical protein